VIVDGGCSGCGRPMSVATCSFVIAALRLPPPSSGVDPVTGAEIGAYLRIWDLPRAAQPWERTAPRVHPLLDGDDLHRLRFEDTWMRQFAADLQRSVAAVSTTPSPAGTRLAAHLPHGPWSDDESPCFRLGVAEVLFELAIDAGRDLHSLRGWDSLVAATAHPPG
jgi:hypothetical protein